MGLLLPRGHDWGGVKFESSRLWAEECHRLDKENLQLLRPCLQQNGKKYPWPTPLKLLAAAGRDLAAIRLINCPRPVDGTTHQNLAHNRHRDALGRKQGRNKLRSLQQPSPCGDPSVVCLPAERRWVERAQLESKRDTTGGLRLAKISARKASPASPSRWQQQL